MISFDLPIKNRPGNGAKIKEKVIYSKKIIKKAESLLEKYWGNDVMQYEIIMLLGFDVGQANRLMRQLCCLENGDEIDLQN